MSGSTREQLTKQYPHKIPGMWLPANVMFDDRLCWSDIILICEIDALDVDDRGCWASDDYLGEFLGCAGGTIANKLTKLRAIEAITDIGRNNQRGLRSLLHARTQGMADPSKPYVVVETERALGFDMSLLIRARVEAVVQDRFCGNWTELIRNRLLTVAGKPQSFIQSRIGYWLDDYQRQEPNWERALERVRGNGHVSQPGLPQITIQYCDDCRDTDGLVGTEKGMKKCLHSRTSEVV